MTIRTSTRQQLGAQGEDLAVAELQRQGMEIVARNWRCRWGEVDVVALEHEGTHRVLVFCEVKTRSGLGYGTPLESITYAKVRRLRQLAGQWLRSEPVHADDIRLDAVGVVLLPGKDPQVTHARAIG